MINITQEQKKMLNDNGVMVAEFKLWCRKVNKIVCDVWRTIADYLVSVAYKVSEALKPVLIAFKDMADRFDKAVEYIKANESVFEIERYRYKPRMNVGSKYICNIVRNRIYHCRNNC